MKNTNVKVKVYGDSAWWNILNVDQSGNEAVYTIGRFNQDGGIDLDMVTFDEIEDYEAN